MANSKQIGPSSTGASLGEGVSIVDLQTLHEVYWAAVEAQLKAGAATLMCAGSVVSCATAKPWNDGLTNVTGELYIGL